MRRFKLPPFVAQPNPGLQEFIDYASGARRVRSAYTIVMLCRFGRWLSWAICPWLRFLPAWTDPVDGHLSLEAKAKMSLSKSKVPWWMVAATPMIAALAIRDIRAKAS